MKRPRIISDVPYDLAQFLTSGLAAKLERRGFVVTAEELSSAGASAEFEADGRFHNALRVDVFLGLRIRIYRRGWFGRRHLLQFVNIGFSGDLNQHHGLCSRAFVVERYVSRRIGPAFSRDHPSIGEAVATLYRTFDWLEKNL